jgi:hypothetical protein
MNQRIQELAQQSELYVDLYGRPYPRAMSAEESHAAYKKFAQLIVRECADIATINQHQWHSAGSYVLKHFGVEE